MADASQAKGDSANQNLSKQAAVAFGMALSAAAIQTNYNLGEVRPILRAADQPKQDSSLSMATANVQHADGKITSVTIQHTMADRVVAFGGLFLAGLSLLAVVLGAFSINNRLAAVEAAQLQATRELGTATGDLRVAVASLQATVEAMKDRPVPAAKPAS